MANRLKMAKVNAIRTLHQQGWSRRKIAEHLGLHRDTVARYLDDDAQNRPPAPTGSEAQNRPPAPTGSGDSKPATAPTGCEPSQSACEPFRQQILEKLAQGLSATRIHQDLIEEDADCEVSYYSVRRFVRSLGKVQSLPFRRIETAAGEEAQVDFGAGAAVRQENGRKKRTYVFRIVLSHSRKAYSEVVYRQTTENFIRAIENAFWYFGGTTQTLVIDNLRAAVKKVDWFEPELNPKVQSFCEHYGVVILPTRPYTPRHKGKVEKGIDYVQSNALKGRVFDSLAAQNEHLLHWEATTADTRIHGTTREQVGKAFREREQEALAALPAEHFPFFEEGERSVHRDGHVEVDKSYYSVPPEFVTRRVWVRWDSRVVRVFNQRMEQIAMHVKQEPGRFSTQDAHLASEKISAVERGAEWLLQKVSTIGKQTECWASELVSRRGIQSVRVLQGLLALSQKHSSEEIDKACEIAASYGAFRLKNVRRLIENQAAKQEELEFLEDHPIIRDLSTYGELVRESFQNQATGKERAVK